MKPSSELHERLERLIDRTLREQPPRRAPGTLESRVLAEIERRAAQPWWRKNFAYWPAPARAGFLLVSAGFAALALAAASWLGAGSDLATLFAGVAQEVAWIHTVAAAISSVVRNLPPLLVYGGLTALAALYIALFGIGAFAYRTLYAGR